MAKAEYTLDINAPIEKAFDAVSDPNKLKIWMEGLEETIYASPLDSNANPVGMKFKQHIREGGRVAEYDGEVTAYDKPHHLGVRVGNQQFTVLVDYRFASTGSGTRLNYSADLRFHTFIARVMGALFSWFTSRILDKQMKRLKMLAEQGA
jgi:carbon monoxide dehydrogenase subunit G